MRGTIDEGMSVDRRHEELLRRLAVHSDEVLESVLGMYISERRGLGPRPADGRSGPTGGLCVVRGVPAVVQWCVSTALDAGATAEDVVGVLPRSSLPIIGVSRVNRAAADIAVAIGIEIDVPGRQ